MKILLPVDGSSHSDRATHHVIAMARGCGGLGIHLINVQPPADALELRSHMPVSEIEAMQETRGGDAMASARRLLDDAGIAYVPCVLLGPVAESIADYATRESCDQVVMGTRGLGALSEALLGSVTADLLSLTDRPVTLIK